VCDGRFLYLSAICQMGRSRLAPVKFCNETRAARRCLSFSPESWRQYHRRSLVVAGAGYRQSVALAALPLSSDITESPTPSLSELRQRMDRLGRRLHAVSGLAELSRLYMRMGSRRGRALLHVSSRSSHANRAGFTWHATILAATVSSSRRCNCGSAWFNSLPTPFPQAANR